MSMLQAQVDELRSMAESVGLAVPQAATLMMEAADTILELRGSVHRERGEADRLRELVRAAWRCIHTGASCSDCRLVAGGCTLQTAMRELGIEVDE